MLDEDQKSLFLTWLGEHGSSVMKVARVLRTQYEPRRQESLTLLASLRDETTSEVSGVTDPVLVLKHLDVPE